MELIGAEMDDVEKIWKMQVEAFQGLYRKYQDTETSPATEKPERIMVRMNQPFTYYYFIRVADVEVGVIRVVDAHDSEKAKRISPFLLWKNTGEMDMHRKQSGWQKKSMEPQIGSWTQSCRKKEIAICMKKWGIAKQERLK